ncbi:hypothetical protein AC579_9410 [Pseudocercospora musae]|uniref:Uncharacterized protein n=1 Tax=Pseudocercospora musae TaxID=113226 RepID=A0A139GX13_9PEZI|nr:hypothetical protein AC579_9410 [Pseudocercospora musae]
MTAISLHPAIYMTKDVDESKELTKSGFSIQTRRGVSTSIAFSPYLGEKRTSSKVKLGAKRMILTKAMTAKSQKQRNAVGMNELDMNAHDESWLKFSGKYAVPKSSRHGKSVTLRQRSVNVC